ncbi:MAG TPA: hypothetical protein VNA18_01720 [Nitrososphaeraceae archaeon]|nr:hypothetical protein [Nitrososphaeraceae archaeon]
MNGQLSMGVITSPDLSRELTDLTNLMKKDSVYVVVAPRLMRMENTRNHNPFKPWLYADICFFCQMTP